MALPNNPDQTQTVDRTQAMEGSALIAPPKSILRKSDASNAKKSVVFSENQIDIDDKNVQAFSKVEFDSQSAKVDIKKILKNNIKNAAQAAIDKIYLTTTNVERVDDPKAILDQCLLDVQTRLKITVGKKDCEAFVILFWNYYEPAKKNKIIALLAESLIAQRTTTTVDKSIKKIFEQASRMLCSQSLYHAYNECEHLFKYCDDQTDIKRLLSAKFREIEIIKVRVKKFDETATALNRSIAELNTKIIEYCIRRKYAEKHGKCDVRADVKLQEAKLLLDYCRELKKSVRDTKLISTIQERLPTVPYTFGGTLSAIRADVKAIRDKLQKEEKKERAHALSNAKKALKEQDKNTLLSRQLFAKFDKLLAELKMREIKYAIRVSKGQEHRGFGKKTTIKSASEKLFATTNMIKEVERLIENLSGNNIPPIEEWNTASAEEGTLKKYYNELQSLSTDVIRYLGKYPNTLPDETKPSKEQNAVSVSQVGFFAEKNNSRDNNHQRENMQLIVHPNFPIR